MTQHLFLLAGEKSGDMIGARLLKALKKKLPNYEFSGVGGQEMREEGFTAVLRTEDFEIHGFSALIGSFFKLRRQFHEVLQHILKTRPEAVVLIDYPGFNLRLAKALRKQGYQGKLIQYVSPTVWAWGAARKQKMESTLDLLLTIYPFEEKYFVSSMLKVKYVGNPIQEIVNEHSYDEHWAALFGIKSTKNLVALFPGSRKSEIELNLPFQLKACEMLKKEVPDTIFAISCAHEKIIPVMHPLLENNSLKLHRDLFLLPKTFSYELMRDCRSAIAKSGTVTLELALHQKPAVVMYKLTRLNRIIAQYILKLNLPHYCIVNILSDKTVYPEIIEKGLTAENLYREFKMLNNETAERYRCIEQCSNLPAILQNLKASEEASTAIVGLLS